MPATWPETLPQKFEASTYSEELADGRLRTPTDTGPGKVRLRSSAMPRPISGAMQMTGAQLEEMIEFITSTIGGGVLPFNFPNPRGGDPLLVRIADRMPSWTPLSEALWSVALRLEVLP